LRKLKIFKMRKLLKWILSSLRKSLKTTPWWDTILAQHLSCVTEAVVALSQGQSSTGVRTASSRNVSRGSTTDGSLPTSREVA
jgi:hypothetical protein